ncbi:MAG: hypothetical protein N3D15_08265 [Syntrophorhabdaceae bacterium]|nr:hypothetical protein [Syntrophorhabdaceae bacterium]
MKDIIIAMGTKDNVHEDIGILSHQFFDSPHNIVVSGEGIRDTVVEIASSLFLEERIVLILVDPDKNVMEEIKTNLYALKGRVPVIIYITSDTKPVFPGIEADVVVMERESEKRLKDRVTTVLKRYGKQMTDKAFDLLKERIRDEAVLETELMKLINYTGDKKRIDSKDIMAITAKTHQDDLIGFFEAFSNKDKKKIIYILDNLINTMNLPLETAIIIIHSYLVKQTRLLLHAKDIEEKLSPYTKYPDFTKVLNRWKDSMDLKPIEKKQYLAFQKPYYAFKLSNTARKFDKKDLISFLDTLSRIDLAIKKGPEHERRVILETSLLEI